MNRERAKELLPIIQAFAEGKEIQYFDDELGWITEDPEWHDCFEYRIKPEPEVIYVNKHCGYLTPFPNEKAALDSATANCEYVAKKFQEVL